MFYFIFIYIKIKTPAILIIWEPEITKYILDLLICKITLTSVFL